MKEMASGLVQEVKEAPSKWVDKRRVNNLKKDAISSNPN